MAAADRDNFTAILLSMHVASVLALLVAGEGNSFGRQVLAIKKNVRKRWRRGEKKSELSKDGSHKFEIRN